jgi:hypothetical protein
MPIFPILRLVCFCLSVLFLGMSKMHNICIQTIGQAYEDMQTQNQHLLQQLTDRDDFNIKVCFSSLLFHFHVKAAKS